MPNAVREAEGFPQKPKRLEKTRVLGLSDARSSLFAGAVFDDLAVDQADDAVAAFGHLLVVGDDDKRGVGVLVDAAQ